MIAGVIGVLFILVAGMSVNAAKDENSIKASTEPTSVSQDLTADYQDVVNQLAKKLQLRIDGVADSPIDGLLQLYTNKGLFYASKDGNYFLQARIFDVKDGISDVTETALKDMRLHGIEEFATSAIEFKAEDEKYVVNVFTDTTCGYCRKLHNEMSVLNDLGITVRYLAYPRAGIGSDSFRDTVSVWCSENPQEAMTKAKAGQQIARTSCQNNVADHYNFGRQVGVTGTPNIILPDGTMIPGYQPANVLLQSLQQISG